MGLFSSKKLIGTVKIKFYGENKVLVNYETDITDPEFIEHSKVELFVMYYAKMLYNLGKGEHADLLIEYVQKASDDTIKNAIVGKKGEKGNLESLGIVKSEVKRPNILGAEQRLVDSELNGGGKTYTGELYQKSDSSLIIQTHMNWGGEKYYIPVSVTMFLQYLINSLSEVMLVYLMVVINFMNKYYREIGSYSGIRSIIDAPNFGLDSTAQLLNLNE